jgi:hypothetical protein
MSKKPKRKNLKLPRKCIFCEGGGTQNNPMTEEHIWSEWMHPYLPKIPNAKKSEVYELLRMNAWVTQTRKKPQQGHVYTKTIKAVCKNCNETWMRSIEENIKPILIPLLRGQPFTLRQKEKIKLATWLTLKVLVEEQEYPAEAVVQQQTRTEFMKSRKIPEETKIWIGIHDTDHWYTGLWHRTLTATLGPTPPITGRLKNIQSTAFGIGHVFSLTILTRVCTQIST